MQTKTVLMPAQEVTAPPTTTTPKEELATNIFITNTMAKTRRKATRYCKKILMFTVVDNLARPYFGDLLHPIIQEHVDHNLRNEENIRNLHARTEHQNSLFLPIVRMWN